MRSDREEVPAPFTKEDADRAEIAEARLRTSRNATACQIYWPSWFNVCGEIKAKYDSLGGPGSFLNYPTSGNIINPGNTGERVTFVNGPIYWSSAGGAHPVVNSILNRWGVHGYEAGWLGYPTTDEIVHADGVGRRQEFQNGAVYVAFSNAIGSAIKNGPIRDKWNSVGAETPGSLLGYITGDEIPLPDGQGRMARFERGVIYSHPTFGAHPVTGNILNHWTSVGYEQSSYGYPKGDAIVQSGVTKQEFQNGWIHSPGMNVPIAGTASNMFLGFPHASELIAGALPDGISLQGNGFTANFNNEASGGLAIKLDLTGPGAPQQYNLMVGLPAGLSWQAIPDGVALVNIAGQQLGSIVNPVAFDALGNRVTSTVSIQGNNLTYQLNVGPSPAYPVRSYNFVKGDTVESNLGDLRKFETCIRTLGGDPISTGPENTACQRAATAANNAAPIADATFGYNNPDGTEWLDGEEDAMRHCLWNAFMAQDSLVGPTYARKISRLHEEIGGNQPDQKEMDYINNEFGVQLFENGQADDATEAVQSCEDAAFYHELRVRNPNPAQRMAPESAPDEAVIEQRNSAVPANSVS